MNYLFHPEAEKEFLEAVNYYNKCQYKLGEEFAKEIYKSIQNILLFPHAWPPFSLNTRRCIINRFPFGVIYQATNKDLYISVLFLN